MKTLTRTKSKKSKKSRQNKLNRELKRELGKKLLGYSATAGAVLTLGTGAAEAVAIKTTPGTPITIINDFLFLDINDDSVIDLMFSAYDFGLFTNYVADVSGGEYNKIVVSSVHYFGEGYDVGTARNLPSLYPINATLLNNYGADRALLGDYSNSFGPNGVGNFLDSRGFLGVRFFDIGGNHFGWVDLKLSLDASVITIYGWGYETIAGTGIQAGAGQESQPVPEPATLATLAMGAVGLYAWRRNRKRKSLKNENNNEAQKK